MGVNFNSITIIFKYNLFVIEKFMILNVGLNVGLRSVFYCIVFVGKTINTWIEFILWILTIFSSYKIYVTIVRKQLLEGFGFYSKF